MVQHVSKKRRAAETCDGVSEGGAGDVARARPTWEDMVIAYSTIPGQWQPESTHMLYPSYRQATRVSGTMTRGPGSSSRWWRCSWCTLTTRSWWTSCA